MTSFSTYAARFLSSGLVDPNRFDAGVSEQQQHNEPEREDNKSAAARDAAPQYTSLLDTDLFRLTMESEAMRRTRELAARMDKPRIRSGFRFCDYHPVEQHIDSVLWQQVHQRNAFTEAFASSIDVSLLPRTGPLAALSHKQIQYLVGILVEMKHNRLGPSPLRSWLDSLSIAEARPIMTWAESRARQLRREKQRGNVAATDPPAGPQPGPSSLRTWIESLLDAEARVITTWAESKARQLRREKRRGDMAAPPDPPAGPRPMLLPFSLRLDDLPMTDSYDESSYQRTLSAQEVFNRLHCGDSPHQQDSGARPLPLPPTTPPPQALLDSSSIQAHLPQTVTGEQHQMSVWDLYQLSLGDGSTTSVEGLSRPLPPPPQAMQVVDLPLSEMTDQQQEEIWIHIFSIMLAEESSTDSERPESLESPNHSRDSSMDSSLPSRPQSPFRLLKEVDTMLLDSDKACATFLSDWVPDITSGGQWIWHDDGTVDLNGPV